MAKGNTKKKRREVALERHKILWDYYNENGRITIRDCLNLLNVSNISMIKASFKFHRLDMPEIYDQTEVRIQRNADLLNDFAEKRNVTELTTNEMAEALGRPINSVHYARQECEKSGHTIPDLNIKDAWRRKMAKSTKKKKSDRMQVIDDNAEIQPEYNEGFLIVSGSERVNPENHDEVIYMLR